jgi:hypothetical protein
MGTSYTGKFYTVLMRLLAVLQNTHLTSYFCSANFLSRKHCIYINKLEKVCTVWLLRGVHSAMILCTHQCTVPILINYSTLQEYRKIISSIIFPFWHSEFNNTKFDFLYQHVFVCDIPLWNTSEKQKKGSSHSLLYFIVSYSISCCDMFWLVSRAIISYV